MNIYLDIDGTLIHEELTERNNQAAAGLEDFLIALRPHTTFWLTTHCRDGNPERARKILKRHLPESLHGDVDHIQPTTWDTMKTEGIDWTHDLLWFDNDISTAEMMRFTNATDRQCFVEIDLRNNPNHLLEVTEDLKGMWL